MIIRCRDTRVQNYPTSASKMKSINCSAWPFLYFVYGIWLKFLWCIPKSLNLKHFFIFQNLDFVARKRRAPAEKCSCRSTKKANVFKAKRLIEKGVPATSARCPDHLSRQFLTSASTFPYNSKNPSAEHFDAFYTCLSVRKCVYVCVCEWMCEYVSVCVCLCEWVCL